MLEKEFKNYLQEDFFLSYLTELTNIMQYLMDKNKNIELNKIKKQLNEKINKLIEKVKEIKWNIKPLINIRNSLLKNLKRLQCEPNKENYDKLSDQADKLIKLNSDFNLIENNVKWPQIDEEIKDIVEKIDHNKDKKLKFKTCILFYSFIYSLTHWKWKL